MQKYINKIIYKIMEITNSSEDDAKKIVAGLMILGIAISWFVMGSFLKDNKENKITPQERQEMLEIQKMMKEEGQR